MHMISFIHVHRTRASCTLLTVIPAIGIFILVLIGRPNLIMSFISEDVFAVKEQYILAILCHVAFYLCIT